MKLILLLFVAGVCLADIIPGLTPLPLPNTIVDPYRSGGFYGVSRGGAWFTATGRYTFATDGSVAWEYTSPWDPEPIWAPEIPARRGGLSEAPCFGCNETALDMSLWFIYQPKKTADPNPWFLLLDAPREDFHPVWPGTEVPEPSTLLLALAGITWFACRCPKTQSE